MKSSLIARLTLLACIVASHSAQAADPTPRLSKGQDAFFIENDLVYRRFLQLSRDGTYRQINRERATGAEVDRGTWGEDTDGAVLLHFTRGALRFHAVLSGPLSIRLDHPEDLSALSAAAGAIRQWLAQGNDAVFAAASAHEIALAPLVLTIDPPAESFRREDLASLARQLDDFVWSERHRTFCLVPCKVPNGPLLLVQRDAVFQAGDLPRVLREHPPQPGAPPPFYFANVDAGTFAREAGSWQELH